MITFKEFNEANNNDDYIGKTVVYATRDTSGGGTTNFTAKSEVIKHDKKFNVLTLADGTRLNTVVHQRKDKNLYNKRDFYILEGKLKNLLATGALVASSAFGDFVQDWSKFYQTDGSSNDPAKIEKAKKNEARATAVLDAGFSVPFDAKKAISVAASIFDGDDGHNAAEIEDYLEKTGAVESGYRTKVQSGDGPARSYWQVEPKTAMDLVKNSSAYFGPKFKKTFGEDALKILQGYNEQQMADLLLKNDTLAASMAAAKWIASPW